MFKLLVALSLSMATNVALAGHSRYTRHIVHYPRMAVGVPPGVPLSPAPPYWHMPSAGEGEGYFPYGNVGGPDGGSHLGSP